MIPQRQSSDLAAESFLVLRTAFFGERAEPQFYQLRDKRNTQDDPFDVYVHQLLEERLPADPVSPTCWNAADWGLASKCLFCTLLHC